MRFKPRFFFVAVSIAWLSLAPARYSKSRRSIGPVKANLYVMLKDDIPCDTALATPHEHEYTGPGVVRIFCLSQVIRLLKQIVFHASIRT